MPFGLCNALEMFQAYIYDILQEYLDDFYITYIDNTLIYLDSKEEHKCHVCFILKKLIKHIRLYTKLQKYV